MLRRCSILLILLFILDSFTIVFATEEIKDWQFSKEINTDSDSPYWSVFLDEEVYANARKDLADLRVVDGDGEFVPYYLASGFGELDSDETVYTSELVYKMEKANETTLDFLGMLSVAPIVFSVDPFSLTSR